MHSIKPRYMSTCIHIFKIILNAHIFIHEKLISIRDNINTIKCKFDGIMDMKTGKRR